MAKACSATIHFPSMQIKHGWHLSRNEAICKQASAMLHISLNACMHSAIPLNFYFKINNTPAYFICSLACLPAHKYKSMQLQLQPPPTDAHIILINRYVHSSTKGSPLYLSGLFEKISQSQVVLERLSEVNAMKQQN